MAVLEIVEILDARLRAVSKPVEQVDDAVRQLIADMADTMYHAHGIGLAAIQVGVEQRVVVIDLQAEEGEDGKPIREPRVFINPEIVESSDATQVYSEGCLSVPDQYADVERPAVVRARWQDRDGRQHDEQLDGMLAICLQHEMDHLEGILFIDHLSRLKRDMVLKKLAKGRLKAA